jgi:ribosomal protein S26
LVRGTFDWGVLDEKRTHPNTNIGRSKRDFGPTSVILCHNCVGAVAYVETKCVLKVKLLSVPKRTRARYEQ